MSEYPVYPKPHLATQFNYPGVFGSSEGRECKKRQDNSTPAYTVTTQQHLERNRWQGTRGEEHCTGYPRKCVRKGKRAVKALWKLHVICWATTWWQGEESKVRGGERVRYRGIIVLVMEDTMRVTGPRTERAPRKGSVLHNTWRRAKKGCVSLNLLISKDLWRGILCASLYSLLV